MYCKECGGDVMTIEGKCHRCESKKAVKWNVDLLSKRAKRWLHHCVQQLNDPGADGYIIGDKTLREECVQAGLVEMRGGGHIFINPLVNDLVYTQGYLVKFA